MFASKEEYQRRYSICKSCEKFDNIHKKCRECGCYMPLKCKASWMKCPKGFWGQAFIESEIDNLDFIETYDPNKT